MKPTLILIAVLFLLSNAVSGQQLRDVLEGYTISKVPTNKSIVGARWVSGLGATTEGLSGGQVTISKSLENMALNDANHGSLSLALLSNLGLGGYSSGDLRVVFNKLEVHTLKDLYELPLVKNEKIVFSSVKAASFDLVFDKNISSQVMAKLPQDLLSATVAIDYQGKKRLSISGADLFVAHQIVKIHKIETKRKSKKFKGGNFEVKDLMGYDFLFNSKDLVSRSIKQAVADEGFDKITNAGNLGHYIKKYSKLTPIKVNITNSSGGNFSGGIFNEIREICYCELSDGNLKIYRLATINSGDKVTYDYFQIDSFWINYFALQGVSKGDDIPVGFSNTDGSKLSLISKTFYLSSVND